MLRYPSVITLISAVLLASTFVAAVDLKPETNAAFNRYVLLSEKRMQNEVEAGPFLCVDRLSPQQHQAAYQRLQRGEVVIQRLETLDRGTPIAVPGGLIHHWTGIVFIPGATLKKTLTVMQAYDEHSRVYAPRVLSSKLIHHSGDDFEVFLRLRDANVVTVVLDKQYAVHYVHLDQVRACGISYSTRIVEVENAGQPNEHQEPAGRDNGYLWRLNSYWRFWERDGGVYVQLEAISLTRDIPEGLGWVVRPFITTIPKESLEFTLNRTRAALVAK